MQIGIDLDGVCYDFTAAFCRNVGWDTATVDKWEFFKDHGWTTNYFLQESRRMIKNGHLFAVGDLVPGTKEAFDALYALGHTIHIITDRCSLDPDDTTLIQRSTQDWLEDNGLQYETIHYTGDKAKVAKELELDFFLDDKIENYDMCAPHTRAYLFARPWNDPAIHGPDEFRTTVSGWGAFVEQVCLHAAAAALKASGETGTLEWKVAPGEVRVTSKTGGEKGQKLARIGSLDPRALLEVAKVAGFGEQKYSRLNYLNGYDWSLSFDALIRHLLAFWSGEDLDPESGLPHLAHAAWHCLCLLAFLQHGIGTDDRFKPGEAA